MLARLARVPRARFQSTQAGFSNKYNFNLLPPPVHEYWNIRNSSIYLVFVPLFAGVAYMGKAIGDTFTVHDTLLEFADAEKSPIKELKFGEPQLRK